VKVDGKIKTTSFWIFKLPKYPPVKKNKHMKALAKTTPFWLMFDVEVVPWVPLNQEARDVPHPRHVDTPGAQSVILGPSKVQRDAPHHEQVIPAVGSLIVRLVLNPPQNHLAVAIALSDARIRPQMLPHRESSVERYVESRGGFVLQNPALMLQDPIVEHDLGHKLVRPVPRRDQLPQHDTGKPGGAPAESIVQLNIFDTLATQNSTVLVKGETLNISQNVAVFANVFIYFFSTGGYFGNLNLQNE
jgi:hypothetical protein